MKLVIQNSEVVFKTKPVVYLDITIESTGTAQNAFKVYEMPVIAGKTYKVSCLSTHGQVNGIASVPTNAVNAGNEIEIISNKSASWGGTHSFTFTPTLNANYVRTYVNVLANANLHFTITENVE